MVRSLAKDYYLGKNGKQRSNCAVAVARAVDEKFSGKIDPANFACYGGGNAPDGICGALFTARQIIKSDSKGVKLLEDQFQERGGALTCTEIRMNRKLPCTGCVDLAAELLEKHL